MVPDGITRRRLLQATGVGLTAGLAGCELRYDPVTETTAETTGTEGDGPTRPSYNDVGPNADDGNGTASDGTDGSRTQTATKTVTAGRTFTIEAANRMSPEDLRDAADVAEDAPVTVSIIVEENWDDGSEERPFEERFDLSPGASRSFPDAFTTKRHGPNYIVRTKLEAGPGVEEARSRNLSDARRFTPGGFQDPGGTTFAVSVGGILGGDHMQPAISLDVPAENEQS